jgi:hypothetical protein
VPSGGQGRGARPTAASSPKANRQVSLSLLRKASEVEHGHTGGEPADDAEENAECGCG